MINKRFSAIALSVLLAFAPVTSLAYSAPVYAAETTGTEAAVNEGTSNDSSAVVPDATYGNETLQNEVSGTNDSTELVTPAPEGEDGTNTGSGNGGEPTGGTKEDEPGVGAQGGEQIEPGTGSGGGEQVDPNTGSGGGEQVDPSTGSENGESGENEDPCVLNGHSWDDGVVEAEADCTNEGRIVFTCTECGDTRYETIGAKGHSFGNWAVVKQATTRVDGTSERTCANCGVVESKVIPHTILKVKSIKLSKTTATVFRWNVVQLNATVAPANATSTAVTWKSSNTKVATVSSSGKVTAVGKGTATITCAARDGSGKKAYCKITVTAPSSGRSSNSGSSSGGGGTVWVSATGSKYHNKNNCGTMNPSKARQMSLSEAKNKGYQPCKNCYH